MIWQAGQPSHQCQQPAAQHRLGCGAGWSRAQASPGSTTLAAQPWQHTPRTACCPPEARCTQVRAQHPSAAARQEASTRVWRVVQSPTSKRRGHRGILGSPPGEALALAATRSSRPAAGPGTHAARSAAGCPTALPRAVPRPFAPSRSGPSAQRRSSRPHQRPGSAARACQRAEGRLMLRACEGRAERVKAGRSATNAGAQPCPALPSTQEDPTCAGLRPASLGTRARGHGCAARRLRVPEHARLCVRTRRKGAVAGCAHMHSDLPSRPASPYPSITSPSTCPPPHPPTPPEQDRLVAVLQLACGAGQGGAAAGQRSRARRVAGTRHGAGPRARGGPRPRDAPADRFQARARQQPPPTHHTAVRARHAPALPRTHGPLEARVEQQLLDVLVQRRQAPLLLRRRYEGGGVAQSVMGRMGDSRCKAATRSARQRSGRRAGTRRACLRSTSGTSSGAAARPTPRDAPGRAPLVPPCTGSRCPGRRPGTRC